MATKQRKPKEGRRENVQQDLCEIVFVLDMTGSMQPLQNDAIGGFNRFVDEQKKVSGKANLTLVLFNSNETRKLFSGADIQSVRYITGDDYQPNAMTPLLDAVGTAIDDLGRRLKEIPEPDRPAKVMMVIMTDGEENYSHKFKRTEVYEKIKHQQDVYKWEFQFLGANIDAFAEAGKLGIDPSKATQYQATSQGIARAYHLASLGATKYRTS